MLWIVSVQMTLDSISRQVSSEIHVKSNNQRNVDQLNIECSWILSSVMAYAGWPVVSASKPVKRGKE